MKPEEIRALCARALSPPVSGSNNGRDEACYAVAKISPLLLDAVEAACTIDAAVFESGGGGAPAVRRGLMRLDAALAALEAFQP